MLLHQLLEKKILILDGAMGTAIKKFNLSSEEFDGCCEILNLTHPEIIKKIHLDYLNAGADIIETNSFNCSSSYTLSKLAAQLANDAVKEYSATNERPIFIAGAVGPTNKISSNIQGISSEMKIDINSLEKAYREQIQGLIDGGIDILLIETIFDASNAKVALNVAQKIIRNSNLEIPIMISATINRDGTLFSGETLVELISEIDNPDIISYGFNCSFGVKELIPFVKDLKKHTDKYISFYPNAGLPDAEGKYLDTPHIMLNSLKELIEKKYINILGGCCGTTPEHILAFSNYIKK